MTFQDIRRFKDDYPAAFGSLLAIVLGAFVGAFVVLPGAALALWLLYKFIEIFLMN